MFMNFNLDEIVLTDTDFAPRRARAKEYLLNFDLDRLLHTFRKQAGVSSQAEPLGGWEEEACGLRGHFTGHFLSACARFAFGDKDPDMHLRVGQIVETLSACARPDGYLSAFEESVLDVLEAEENRDVWAPYYTLHKILQGLTDAYRFTDNRTALDLAVNLAKYIHARFQKLSFWKIDGMLRCTKVNPVNEFGGIGDVLYSLHEITGEEELLGLAKTFDRPYFLDNLAAGHDVLENLHANTHFPMILAAMHRYDLTGEAPLREAALHFLSFLAGRTFANGCSSSKATAFIPGQVSEKSEHWGAYGDLHDALTGGECESCCAHNTERVLEHAFQWTGEARWMEWLETLKYSAVLNSASSVTGLSQYHQPLGVKVHKKFSRPFDDFWCCTGSGIEAMSELQKNIWLHDGEVLLVNMPVSSVLRWKEKDLQIEQKSDFPDHASAIFTVRTSRPATFTLRWKASSVRGISLNGNPVELEAENGFVSFRGEFRDGDVIEAALTAELSEVPLPGDPTRRALRLGPVLLAEVVPEGASEVDSDAASKVDSEAASEVDSEPVSELVAEAVSEAASEASIESSAADGNPSVSGHGGRMVPIYRIETETYSVYRGQAGLAPAGSQAEEDAVQDGRAAYATNR